MSDSDKAVLDREYATQTAAHFGDALRLINKLIDYGTSLVPLAFTNSPRDLKAICIIFVQLRQFLVHLDGAAILSSAGNCSSATLQRRSLLETALTIEWILASDTDNRVNHLYVANLRRRCQWNRITVPGTPEATRHADAASRLALTPEQQKEISDEIARTDALLARPPFDVINAKFEPHYQRRGYDQPWHEVYGVPSIRKISDDLGRLKEYTYVYSPFSGVTHGSDMWKSIEVGEKNIAMQPIREPDQIPDVVRHAVTLALRVYGLIIKQYVPAEEPQFNLKYRTEWRERFLKQYHVEISPKEVII
jgi:Family of unknown function (DUF5677)